MTNNLPISRYVNQIENKIIFPIKAGYCFERLTPGTMKLLGNTKLKITKDENGENVFPLEITEVVLVCCNIVSNNCQHNSRV